MPTTAYTTATKGQCVRLRLTYDGEHLRIEVWDPIPTPPVMGTPALDDESGRGLPIVQALSVGCGWFWSETGPDVPQGSKGKVVWARVMVGAS